MHFNLIDITIVIFYLFFMIILGLKLGKTNKSSDDYFLAGRSMPFFPIGLSVIATMVSAATFIGGPGGSYQDGLKYFMINSNLPLVLFIASAIFLPFLYNLKVTSCYEYLHKRFGQKIRVICAVAFLLTSIVLVGTMIYGPSMVLQALTGWDMKIIIPIIIAISIMYTLVGGIRAVIWTDFVQMIVLWFGLFFCLSIAFDKTGYSVGELIQIASASGKLKALDFSSDLSTANGVWVSLIGVGLLHLQYFTCDQSQVQRFFTSKSMKTLKKSFLVSGIVVNIQFGLFMIIGVLLFIAYNGQSFSDPNTIMINFLSNNIPQGVFGLILVSIIAGTMSSIDSLLNSMSAVYINDIHMPIFKNKKNDSTDLDLKITRKITFVFAIIIALFTYFELNGNTTSIVTMMGSYSSYISGSILGVFLLGMFTTKTSENGAIGGFIMGIISTALVAKFTTINWGWYNVVGVIACFVVAYVYSVFFEKDSTSKFEEYTYWEMRRNMLKNNTLKEDGVYIIPGYLDKYEYILLGVFILQFVILGFITFI